MRIGLIDIDGHNFPNLALMKISAYHKAAGNTVEWLNPYFEYDIAYVSKVFTFSPDNCPPIHASQIFKGGAGYDLSVALPPEIDNCCPDYSLYPKYKRAYGFLTRGCPNKCSWCIVPQKEGNIKPYSDIEEFLAGRKSAILMDNNVLASEYGIRQIEKIVKLGIKIDFNQGLDVRILAQDKALVKLLSQVKWIRFIRIACDHKSQIPFIKKALKHFNGYGVKNYRFFSYLLVKDIQDAYQRALFLKKLNIDVFAQPYYDFEHNIKPSKEQKRFARYVNHKAIFKTIKFEDYH